MNWFHKIIILGMTVSLLGIAAVSALAAGDWPTGRYDYYRRGFSAYANVVNPPFQLRWGYWCIDPSPGEDIIDVGAGASDAEMAAREMFTPPVVGEDRLIVCSRRSIYGFDMKNHEKIDSVVTQSAWSDKDWNDPAYTKPEDPFLGWDWKYDLEDVRLTDCKWEVVGAPTISNGRVFVALRSKNTNEGKVLCLAMVPTDDQGAFQRNGRLLWEYTSTSKFTTSPVVWNISTDNFNGEVVIVGSTDGTDSKVIALNAIGNSTTKTTSSVWTYDLTGKVLVGDPLMVQVPLEPDPEDSTKVTKAHVLVLVTDVEIRMISPGNFTYIYTDGRKIDWKATDDALPLNADGSERTGPLWTAVAGRKFNQTPAASWILTDPSIEDIIPSDQEIPETNFMPILWISDDDGTGKGKLYAVYLWDFQQGFTEVPAGSRLWNVNIGPDPGTASTTASCPVGFGSMHYVDPLPDPPIDRDRPLVFVGTLDGKLICYDAFTGAVTDPDDSTKKIPLWSTDLPDWEDGTPQAAAGGPGSGPVTTFIPTLGGRTYICDPAQGTILTYITPGERVHQNGVIDRPGYHAPTAFWDDWVVLVDGNGWVTVWERYLGGSGGDPPLPNWGPDYNPYMPQATNVATASSNITFKFDILDPKTTRTMKAAVIKKAFDANPGSMTMNNGLPEKEGDALPAGYKEAPTFEWGDTIWVGIWDIKDNNGNVPDKTFTQSMMMMVGGTPINRQVTIAKGVKQIVLPIVLNPFARSTRDVQMNNSPLTPGDEKSTSASQAPNVRRYSRCVRRADRLDPQRPFRIANPLALIGSSAASVTPPTWESGVVPNAVPRLSGTNGDLGLGGANDLDTYISGTYKNDLLENGSRMTAGGADSGTSWPVYVALGNNEPGATSLINPAWAWDRSANLAIIDRSNLWSVRDNHDRVRGVRMQKVRVEPAPLQRARDWATAGTNDWPINFMDSTFGIDQDTPADYPGIPASAVHVTHLSDNIDATRAQVSLDNAGVPNLEKKTVISPSSNPVVSDLGKKSWCFKVTVDVPAYQPADPGYRQKIDLQNRNATYGYMSVHPSSIKDPNWKGGDEGVYKGAQSSGQLGVVGERDCMFRVYIDTNGNGRLDTSSGYEEAYRTFVIHMGVNVQKKISIVEPVIDLVLRPHGFNPDPMQPLEAAKFTLLNHSNVNLKHILVDTEYFPLVSSDLEPYSSNLIPPGFLRSSLNLMPGGTFSKKPLPGSISPRLVQAKNRSNGQVADTTVSVALPTGAPEGYYEKKLLVYVDEPATDYKDPTLSNPNTTNGKLDVASRTSTGPVVPMEPYTPPTATVKIKSVKARLTDGVSPGLPGPQIPQIATSAGDFMPTAFRSSKGLHLIWASDRAVSNAPAGSSYLYFSTLDNGRIGQPYTLGVNSWWNNAGQFPTPGNSPYTRLSPEFESYTAPAVVPNSTGTGGTLLFQGEAWKKTASGDYIRYSNIFAAPLGPDGAPSGAARLVGLQDITDPFTGSTWRRPQGASINNGSPWIFWYGGSGNQWRIYYANPSTNQAVLLPTPGAMVYAMEPSPVARVFDGKPGFDVVYSGLVQVDGKTALYLGRYIIVNDGLVPFPMAKQSEWALKPSSVNRALFYARGLDWNTDPKTINVTIHNGPDTYDLSGINPSRDPNTGKLTYNVPRFGKVVVDPSEGTVLMPVMLTVNSRVQASYMPRVIRLSTDNVAESAPVAFLDNSTDPASMPGPVPRCRLWVFHKRAASNGRPASIAYKALRLGINVGEQINLIGPQTPDAGASESPYCVNPHWGQFFFTEAAEYKSINVSYNGSRNISNASICWIQEKHTNDQGSAVINTDPPLNDGSVWPAPQYSTNSNGQTFCDKIWIFWSSTRPGLDMDRNIYSDGSGTSDIYYQTISPRLTP